MTNEHQEELLKNIRALKGTIAKIENELQPEPIVPEGWRKKEPTEVKEPFDKCWYNGEWHPTKPVDFGLSVNNTTYITPIIPDGFERVESGQHEVKGDKYWGGLDFLHLSSFGKVRQSDLVIRPVNKYPDGWWEDRLTEQQILYIEWQRANRKRLRHLQILETRIAELNAPFQDDSDMPKEMFHFVCAKGRIIVWEVVSKSASLSISFYDHNIGKQIIKELGYDFIKIALNFV